MIERLSGTCILKQAGMIVLDVGGVGYGVEMTETALSRLAEGSHVSVWTHTYVREDALRLYGFIHHGERLLFNLLLSISGIGPKVAMAILGVVPLSQLSYAVEHDEPGILEEVSGIGPRQSKKILLELRPKLEKLAALGFLSPANEPKIPAGAVVASLFDDEKRALPKALVDDLKSALENFGYKDKELQLLLRRFEREPPARDLPALIRLALAELSSAKTAGEKDGRGRGGLGTSGMEELF